jgi:hypothetical protein
MQAEEVDVPRENLTFCYTYHDDSHDKKVKANLNKIFTRQGFIYKTQDEITTLFDSNDELCKKWTLKQHVKESITSKYFTICLLDNDVMKCIMTLSIDYEYKKITEMTIVYYCCVNGSNQSRILLHKLRDFKVPIHVISSNNSYWEHMNAKKNYENNYTLGGRTKRKNARSRKRYRSNAKSYR